MQIEPRPFSQVLGETMGTLGRTWKSLISPALVVFIPAGVLTFIVFRLTGAGEAVELLFDDLQAISPDELRLRAAEIVEAVLWSLAIQGVASVYVYLAAHHVTASAIAGEQVGPAQARRHAGRTWIRGLIAMFFTLAGVVALLAAGIAIWMLAAVMVGSVFLAMILLLVLLTPAAWLGVVLSMATAVISVERTGPLVGLQRSMFLVRGRVFPTLGYLLLVGLLGAVAVQLIQMVAIPLVTIGGSGAGFQLAAVLGIAVQGMIVAGMAAMYTGWYVDLRARKETLLSDSLLSGGL